MFKLALRLLSVLSMFLTSGCATTVLERHFSRHTEGFSNSGRAVVKGSELIVFHKRYNDHVNPQPLWSKIDLEKAGWSTDLAAASAATLRVKEGGSPDEGHDGYEPVAVKELPATWLPPRDAKTLVEPMAHNSDITVFRSYHDVIVARRHAGVLEYARFRHDKLSRDVTPLWVNLGRVMFTPFAVVYDSVTLPPLLLLCATLGCRM